MSLLNTELLNTFSSFLYNTKLKTTYFSQIRSNLFRVVGVLEANFVEPAHDKQGFERTTALARLEARLIHLQKNYWFVELIIVFSIPTLTLFWCMNKT